MNLLKHLAVIAVALVLAAPAVLRAARAVQRLEPGAA